MSVVRYEESINGFIWGPADLTRVFQHEGSVVIRVEGARGGIDVYVTPGGKVRVFEALPGASGAEWKRPSPMERKRVQRAVGWRRR